MTQLALKQRHNLRVLSGQWKVAIQRRSSIKRFLASISVPVDVLVSSLPMKGGGGGGAKNNSQQKKKRCLVTY